ncbi:benenodin family lasso peptide [Sphingobium sp. Z007]|nr:benenodin family lasso peptide [Sphingobium sp. Z007]
MERDNHSDIDLIDLGPAIEQTKGNNGVSIDQAQQKLQSGLSDD